MTDTATRAKALDPEIAERLRALSTSTLSDALDRLGLRGAVEGLVPMSPGQGAGRGIVGRAFTVAYLPAGAGGGTVGDFIDELGPGDVVVIDNRGRTDCTVWGNIMTEVAKARGIEGTVIDGVNRDVNESREIGYAIWSRRGHMRTGKDRVVLQAVQVPVALGRVRVDPGDILRADDNGVVVLPAARAEEVLTTAEAIEAREDDILAMVRDGVPLGEARARHGYHALQTRRD